MRSADVELGLQASCNEKKYDSNCHDGTLCLSWRSLPDRERQHTAAGTSTLWWKEGTRVNGSRALRHPANLADPYSSLFLWKLWVRHQRWVVGKDPDPSVSLGHDSTKTWGTSVEMKARPACDRVCRDDIRCSFLKHFLLQWRRRTFICVNVPVRVPSHNESRNAVVHR